MAIKAGIDPAAIEAIRTGGTPKLTKSDEQAIYDFAIELITRRRVSDTTFERTKKEIGLTSVIDLVGIIGYYSLVSVTLNAFEIPLPEGEKSPFDVK
jgi:4-carboxymuconolactone decarboxylase